MRTNQSLSAYSLVKVIIILTASVVADDDYHAYKSHHNASDGDIAGHLTEHALGQQQGNAHQQNTDGEQSDQDDQYGEILLFHLLLPFVNSVGNSGKIPESQSLGTGGRVNTR